MTAGSLSNQGGQIAAQGNVSLNIQSLANGSAAPTSSGTLTSSTPTGMIAAGNDINISSGGNLTNAGLIYAGNNVDVQAGSLTNEGGNQQNSSSQTGCASGVPNSACDNAGSPRGGNPNTTTFSYSQSDATIYAGNDLVIAAGQINNTYGNLLAGYDIVIGGVGTTASSTTPAQSLNNTSGNIVAGNNITLDVSGAITNNLPPPVPVHQNYGSQQEYAGCMTAGGYKESYCEAYVDQQSGTSSVISAGNNLQINAGSLTNIGSLISAGTSATINVTGPVVNEAQTLNAYWHSEWVQETGDFSPDIRHNVWACGSVAECTALYGSAYTSVGGTIDPPTPVGNIAATIEAPNLSITSGGVIQNVGNVIGTSVVLTGQKLINGITTANTYTPSTNSPSQVISLSPLTLPGLNLSTPRTVGEPLPTSVAGTASYVDGTLGASQASLLGPQQLLNALPANLQPSSTLFYYNPQEEDLVLQQAALQQTGQASFITGLSYNSTTGASITDQEKQILYGNALTYAEQNNLQLGTALSQTQINALTEPMLWYVEQTVPDPSCTATGTATCPTITALMPQVYLPQNTSALSAGGNIEASNSLTLNFGDAASGGSVTNTGTITSGGSLTVNTGTLTNEANQVNVGSIWNSVKGGYTDTTGTEVQPGGFMSAANMNLNVQTLNQIGGALQELNSDGTVNQAGTQQMLAELQQQLGGNFTQSSVSNNLNTSFTAEGGFGVGQLIAMIAAVALSAMGMPIIAAMLASTIDQLASGQGFSIGGVLEAGAVALATDGLDSGLGLGDLPLQDVGNDIATGTATAAEIGQAAEEIAGQSLVSATVNTVAYGGSFGQALESGVASNLATVGASTIGGLQLGTVGSVLAHSALGCAASAAEGTGCASGAIGGAASAAFSPDLISAMDPSGAPLTTGQQAALGAFATLLGGGLAGLAGQNIVGGATAAQNEALNNAGNPNDVAKSAQNGGVVSAFLGMLSSSQQQANSMMNAPSNIFDAFLNEVFHTSSPQGTQNTDDLGSGGGSNNTPSTGAAPVTTEVCIPGEGCIVTPSLVPSGSPNNTPSNTTLSSGNGDGDSGSGSTGQGPSTDTATGATASTGNGGSSGSGGAAANAIGAAREQAVADEVGGTVSGEIIRTSSGSTDVDVTDGAGNLYAVGGPAKANNLGAFVQSLMIYSQTAAARGVNAYFYYASGTPQSVINAATKVLGSSFVKPIP